MEVPLKYRALGDFHEYYSGKRIAPYLTLFVGGNHEASSHLHELYYGGWVAPNIYYLGAANVIRCGDLRIASMSGIWKGYSYKKPHSERVPYTPSELRSIYHVREINVRKLLLLQEQVDIGISHDWPRAIEWSGNHKQLFNFKPHFEQDSRDERLGSAAAKYVMDRLRPPYWFSAHMHAKFSAIVKYGKASNDSDLGKHSFSETLNGTTPDDVLNKDEINLDSDGDGDTPAPMSQASITVKNSDEIDLDLDDESGNEVSPTLEPAASSTEPSLTNVTSSKRNLPESSTVSDDLRAQLPASFTRPTTQYTPTRTAPHNAPLPPPPTITNTTTSFLALDKCLPNRKFLQLLTVSPLHPSSPPLPPRLSYDPDWLSILRVFGPHNPHLSSPPNLGESAYLPLIAAEREWVDANLVVQNKLQIPENFELTAPVYEGEEMGAVGVEQPKEFSNPQTMRFCELVGIRNWFHEDDKEKERWRERKMAVCGRNGRVVVEGGVGEEVVEEEGVAVEVGEEVGEEEEGGDAGKINEVGYGSTAKIRCLLSC
ncbi:uncharacterized protein KY384_007816 [Bacidia gigantensis]|uniref:uncharacterized protein n=1 Tax=Bacidia gigantensis TaxID=2732470 RepID=UPI001D05A8C6|nr:uncharacterized protein KY384_007816 [Bacidia gigantensis]KAG8527663.1 hypothetical protein KY384_007816 [Bacidia gigantensis]